METSPNPHNSGPIGPQPARRSSGKHGYPTDSQPYDASKALEFVNLWSGLTGQAHITLTAIATDNGSKTGTVSLAIGDDDKIKTWFVTAHGVQCGAYYTVNGTASDCGSKPSKADITARYFCYIDLDPQKGLPLKEERVRLLAIAKRMTESDVAPTIIVDSGNGIQALWRLEYGVSTELCESFSLSIHKALGASGTHNVDRLLRVPGTINFPDAGKIKSGRSACPATLLYSNESCYGPSQAAKLGFEITKLFAGSDLIRAHANTSDRSPSGSPEEEDLIKSISNQVWKHNPQNIKCIDDLPSLIRTKLESMLTKGAPAYHKELDDRWHGLEDNLPGDKSTSAMDFSIAGYLNRSKNFDRVQVALILFAFKHGQVTQKDWAKTYSGDYDRHPEYYRVRAAVRAAVRAGNAGGVNWAESSGKDKSDDNVVHLSAVPDPDWTNRLEWKKDKNGNRVKVIPTLANALIIIEYDEAFANMLEFDDFKSHFRITKSPPKTDINSIESSRPHPRLWDSDDISMIRAYFQRVWESGFVRADIKDAMVNLARKRTIHPVKDYLRALVWDKTPRLDTWLTSAFGVPASSKYSKHIGSKVLIAAVRRMVRDEPTKFDYVVILEGDQGMGKSTALKKLFSEEWFSDSLPTDIGSKDAAMAMAGTWCIELAEIENFIKNEDSWFHPTKGFLSRAVDRFRPPYAENDVERKRSSIMIGTTNKEDYLRDSTGNRRYWPVRCEKCDLDWIVDNRDQLWAEAVEREVAGEAIHLDSDIEKIAKSEQEDRFLSDPWEDEIIAATKSAVGGEISIADILAHHVFLSTDKRAHPSQKRVGDILRKLGWMKTGSRKPDSGGVLRFMWAKNPKRAGR